MKKHHFIIIPVIIAVITSIITGIVYNSYNIYKIETIDVDYNITEGGTIGINADTDAIHFGRVSPGFSAEREFTVSSDKDAVIITELKGIDYVSLNPSYAQIKAGEKISFKVYLNIPENALVGYHKGEIKIITRRP